MSIVLKAFVFFFLINNLYSQTDSIVYWKNGNLKFKGQIIKNDHFTSLEKCLNKKFGIWDIYNEKGEKVAEMNIKEGQMNHKIIFVNLDTTEIKFTYGFIDKDSLYLNGYYYYENSLLKSKQTGFFSDNKQTGQWVSFTNDNIVIIENYKNGKKDGVSMYFGKDGILSSLIIFCNDNKRQIFNYDRNGLLEFEGKVDSLDCFTGEGRRYLNGKLIEKGNFFPDKIIRKIENDTVIYINKDGKNALELFDIKFIRSINFPYYFKDGKWEYWDENGKLIKIEYYKKGILKKVKEL